MDPELEGRIGDLYALPPERFTVSRNEVADALESWLVERALMELVANQAVLNEDPANALLFSMEEHNSNWRIAEAMRRTRLVRPRSARRRRGNSMRWKGSFDPTASTLTPSTAETSSHSAGKRGSGSRPRVSSLITRFSTSSLRITRT